MIRVININHLLTIILSAIKLIFLVPNSLKTVHMQSVQYNPFYILKEVISNTDVSGSSFFRLIFVYMGTVSFGQGA